MRRLTRPRRLLPLLCAGLMLPWAAWQPVTAAAQTANELPAIGSGADSTLTLDEEYQIGLSVVRGLREQGLVLEDPEADDYIQALGIRLASQIPDSRQRFKFFVVRDPAINAFALPGGFIGVNQGLITATANEAQLAGVLAHEISHVTQRHIARALQAQGRQGMASAATLLAAILIGMATGSSDAMQAGIAVAQGTAVQQQINFTRANEYEADRLGIGLLASAGFDPNAMPDFFETLGRRTGLAGIGVPELLRTHPVTANRIAESRDRAAQLRPAIAVQTQTWAFFRERVRVLGGPVQGDLRAYYATLADTRTLTPAQRYGEALAQLVNGQRSEAVATLRELAAAQPDSPLLQAALGQALVVYGQPDEAIGLLRRALSVSPRNVPLTIRYAEALLRAGEPKEAHTVLLDLFNNVPPTPEQIRLTALAASSAGDTADAYYYMGEYHIASGDLAMAVKQQELALADPDISPVQRARFEARKKEVEDALKESGKRRQRERSQQGGARMG
jgi:predicted Zn-dependent protease